MDEMSQLLDPQRSQAPMAGVESSPPSFYRQPLATVCARSDGVERSTLVSRDPQGSLRSASLPGSSLDWRSRPLRHWVPRSRRVRATQRCPSSHAVAVRFSTQEQAVTVTSCDLRFYLPSAPGVGGSPSPLPLLAAASASILSSSICLWSHVGISPRFSVRLQASPIVMLDSSEPGWPSSGNARRSQKFAACVSPAIAASTCARRSAPIRCRRSSWLGVRSRTRLGFYNS
jgi:hypothetical protein